MMSRCAPPHQPLTCARVLYIGRAAPQSAHDGLDSIQKPLAELYGKSDRRSQLDDHDSTLHIVSSGLLMKPVNPLDKDMWLRIQDLESCASVKAFSDPNYCGQLIFVPTDSPAGRSSRHPSIFTVVMKRSSGGIKISDCYAFICHSDETAMILVRACGEAYGNKRGWSDERPTLVELGLERPEVKLDNECYVDDFKDDCTPEYYEKPSLSGFFYAPRSDLIQKYNIKGEDDFGRPIGESRMIEHFTCEQSCACPPDPPPQPAPVCVPICDRPQNYYVQQVGYPGQQMMMAGQQSNVIQPQQTQLYYGANVGAEGRQAKVDKKARKEMKKGQHNGTWIEDYDYRALQSGSSDNGGGRYLQMQSDEPIYMRSLPHEDVIMAENKRRGLEEILPVKMAALHSANPLEYRQEASQYGIGDYGPPPGAGDVDPYSRQLPVTAGGQRVSGFRNFDGNFILKKSDEYKYGAAGGPGGIRMGSVGIGDIY